MFLDRLLKPKTKPKSELELISDNREPITFSSDLENNLAQLTAIIGQPLDLVVHRIIVGEQTAAVIIYLKSLVNSPLLGTHVIDPLNNYLRKGDWKELDVNITRSLLSVSDIRVIKELGLAVEYLMAGEVLVIMSKSETVLTVFFPGFPRRSIEDAPSEQVMKRVYREFTGQSQHDPALDQRP